MKTFKPQPQMISIFVPVHPRCILVDKRSGRQGIVFGAVNDVAAQYDLKIEERDEGLIFTGTRTKLQIFVEKLHFSGIQYWEV